MCFRSYTLLIKHVCEILAVKSLDREMRENELLEESVGIVEYNYTYRQCYVLQCDGFPFPFRRSGKFAHKYNTTPLISVYLILVKFPNQLPNIITQTH